MCGMLPGMHIKWPGTHLWPVLALYNAGVVGLACARAAALKGYDVVILEAESTIGSVTSSRHSEVIHAGIYYPEGSWKARLCVEGKWMLYAYCKDKDISFKQLGKLIVATDAQ